MSSLPNIKQASNGRFNKVFHFDNKNQIEQWARDKLPAVTALHPGKFAILILVLVFTKRYRPVLYKHAVAAILQAQLYAPSDNSVDKVRSINSSSADGTVRFCPPVDGNKLIDWVDPTYDIGVYAAGTYPIIL